MVGRCGHRRDTSRREHHERLGQSGLARSGGERTQVATCDGREVCVGRRRRRAFVLAELGRHLVRRDDVHVRCLRRSSTRDGPLVRRVAERKEEADGDRVDVAEIGERREIEWLELAVRASLPAHAAAALERNERLGLRHARPIQVRARLAAEVE